MDAEYERTFRRELEAAGEVAVRADFYGGGSLSTGGEDRRKIIREWLRGKEQERQRRKQQSDFYGLLMFWVTVGVSLAAVVGIIVAIL
jgi:hypothetical protein